VRLVYWLSKKIGEGDDAGATMPVVDKPEDKKES